MVRKLLFVAVAGAITLAGGIRAVSSAVQSAPTTNGTEAVVNTMGSLGSGFGGLIIGLVGLVLLAAVTGLAN